MAVIRIRDDSEVMSLNEGSGIVDASSSTLGMAMQPGAAISRQVNRELVGVVGRMVQ